MELISKDELKTFHNDLGEIIDKLDTKNPLDTISFANSLINMGTYLINQSSSKLIAKAFSKKEIRKMNAELEKRKPLKEA